MQERFVEEYMIDLNASAAARRAGFGTPATQGVMLLKKPQVADAVRRMKKARAHTTSITAERVLRELALCGLSRIDDFEIDGEGNVKVRKGIPDSHIRAISSVKRKHVVNKHGELVGLDVEFKLWDKPATLRTIAQHLGMLVERVAHEHDVGEQLIDILTSAARGNGGDE